MTGVTGLDVSHWQRTTPRLAGHEFLFARATIGTEQDSLYDAHIAAARKAGVLTGAYHFNWDTVSVDAQVDAFLRAAGDVDLYALDVEGANAFSHRQAEDFIDGVQSRGHKIGLYHSLSGFFAAGQDWDWVAYWADQPPPRSWDIWQFGPINGIDGNRFNGSLEALQALAGTGGSMAQTPITDTTPKIIDIPKASKRYNLDSKPDGYTFVQGHVNRPSPYGVGSLRSFYATVDGKLVLRLAAAVNVRDIPGVPAPPADATPFSQTDVDDAYNDGVAAAALLATTARR